VHLYVILHGFKVVAFFGDPHDAFVVELFFVDAIERLNLVRFENFAKVLDF
jgi:hypothetical protein